MNNKIIPIICSFLLLLGISSSSIARNGRRGFSGGRGGHYGYAGHRGYHHGRGYHNGRWGALVAPAIIGGAVATAVEASEDAVPSRVYDDDYDYVEDSDEIIEN